MIVRGFTTTGTGEKLTPFPCGPGGSGTDTDDQQATEVPFDNTGTDLAATDVQAAIEELAAQVAACCDSMMGGGQFSTGDLLSTGEVGGGSGDLVLISEVVTSGSQADVTFSSIPATYRDLEIHIRGRGDTAALIASVRLQFNGDTGANYHSTIGVFNASTATTAGTQSQTSITRILDIPAASATATYSGVCHILIGDYRGTTFFKHAVGYAGMSLGTGGTSTLAESGAGTWISTAAINAIKVFLSAGNFVDGSVVSLYGRM